MIFRVGGYNKIFFLEIKFYFFPTFRKITVGGFVNQLIKKFWPYQRMDLQDASIDRFFSQFEKIIHHSRNRIVKNLKDGILQMVYK